MALSSSSKYIRPKPHYSLVVGCDPYNFHPQFQIPWWCSWIWRGRCSGLDFEHLVIYIQLRQDHSAIYVDQIYLVKPSQLYNGKRSLLQRGCGNFSRLSARSLRRNDHGAASESKFEWKLDNEYVRCWCAGPLEKSYRWACYWMCGCCHNQWAKVANSKGKWSILMRISLKLSSFLFGDAQFLAVDRLDYRRS